jgi:hypothetical protein
MSIQQCYFDVTPEISKSALVGGGSILRGYRVTLNAADGSVSLATNTVRGDFVTTQELWDNSSYETAAGLNQPGTCSLIQRGGIVVVSSSTTATVGATCYVDNTANSGQVSTASSSGIVFGKYMNACAAGDLVSVLVENPL